MATVEQFAYWQEKGAWHPLTCGNDSSHRLLKPIPAAVEGEVLLVCLDCEYAQTPAPYLHEMAATMQEYGEILAGKGHQNGT